MVRKRILLMAVLAVVAGTGLAVASGAVDPSQCEPVNKTENVSTERLQNRTNASDYQDSRRNVSDGDGDGIVITGRKLAELAIDEILEENPCGNGTAPNGSTNATTPTGTATSTDTPTPTATDT
jgi:opacity protein-like surface antigen